MSFTRFRRGCCWCVVVGILCGIPASLSAQTPQVLWTQGNVASATQASGFTYRLTVTPAGGTASTPIVLTNVSCTGAAPSVACTAPLPSAAAAATVTGSKSTMTTQDTAGGTPESAPSAPFTAGAAVPGTLRIQ